MANETIPVRLVYRTSYMRSPRRVKATATGRARLTPTQVVVLASTVQVRSRRGSNGLRYGAVDRRYHRTHGSEVGQSPAAFGWWSVYNRKGAKP